MGYVFAGFRVNGVCVFRIRVQSGRFQGHGRLIGVVVLFEREAWGINYLDLF